MTDKQRIYERRRLSDRDRLLVSMMHKMRMSRRRRKEKNDKREGEEEEGGKWRTTTPGMKNVTMPSLMSPEQLKFRNSQHCSILRYKRNWRVLLL